jgi:hypothetical protein
MQRAVLNRATIEVADTTEVSGFDLFRKCAFTISYQKHVGRLGAFARNMR